MQTGNCWQEVKPLRSQVEAVFLSRPPWESQSTQSPEWSTYWNVCTISLSPAKFPAFPFPRCWCERMGRTYSSSDVSVYPVLVLLILNSHKAGQQGDESCEVEKCRSSREPKLLEIKYSGQQSGPVSRARLIFLQIHVQGFDLTPEFQALKWVFWKLMLCGFF